MPDDDLPNFQQVFAMPEFRQLDGVEKIKFLDKYPQFQQLPLKEKVSFIGQGLQEIHMKPRGALEEARRLVTTLGGDVVEMGKSMWQAAAHPLDTLTESNAFRAGEAGQGVQALRQGRYGEAAHRFARSALGETGTAIAHQQLEQARAAKQAYQSGERAELIPGSGINIPGMPGPHAFGHAAAAAVPVVGPAAAQAGREFAEQGPASGQAWAHTAELLGPDLVSAGLGLTESAVGAGGRAAMRNKLTPEQAARYARLQARARAGGYTGRLLTPGEEVGSRPVIRVERAAEAQLGSSGPAERMYTARAGELERQARASTAAVSSAPQALDEIDAAQDVIGEASRTIRKTKAQADTVYNQVRANAASDRRILQIGVKKEWDAAAEQWVYKPIYGEYDAPVALKPLRVALRPLYNEFTNAFKDLDEAQRNANPGYRALRNIMTDVDPLTGKARMYAGAMDLESDLRAIKAELRKGQFSPFLTSPSGRVQLRVLNEGYDAVNKALDRAKPGTSALLQRGQQLVRSYSSSDRILSEIIGKDKERLDPLRLYKVMTQSGDSKLFRIQRLAQIAPDTSRALWRTYLEGLLTDATKDLGRLKEGSGKALMDGFDKLGKRTKQIALGAQRTRELTDVFQGIKDLMPKEGSPTGYRIIAIGALGAAGEALGLLIGGHPLGFMGFAAHTAAAGVGLNILSRIWFAPGGAAATARLLRAAKIGGAAFREASRVFMAYSATAEKEQKQEQQAQPGGQQGSAAPAAAPQKPHAKATPFTPEMEQAFQDAGRANGVPASILRGIAKTESKGDPTALSPKGAMGLMQFMPGTAEDYGVDPTDPVKSIWAAARLVGKLGKRYGGDWNKALKAYNAGPAAVDRYGGAVPYRETEQYPNLVLAAGR